jgi:hypothetical protein
MISSDPVLLDGRNRGAGSGSCHKDKVAGDEAAPTTPNCFMNAG